MAIEKQLAELTLAEPAGQPHLIPDEAVAIAHSLPWANRGKALVVVREGSVWLPDVYAPSLQAHAPPFDTLQPPWDRIVVSISEQTEVEEITRKPVLMRQTLVDGPDGDLSRLAEALRGCFAQHFQAVNAQARWPATPPVGVSPALPPKPAQPTAPLSPPIGVSPALPPKPARPPAAPLASSDRAAAEPVVRPSPAAGADDAGLAAHAAGAGLPDFEASMAETLASRAPQSPNQQERDELVAWVRSGLVQPALGPQMRVELFGSSATELHFIDSDVDLNVLAPAGRLLERKQIQTAIFKLAAAARYERLEAIMPITKAIVPILRFQDPKTGLSVDLSFGNSLALHNTALVRAYVSLDPRVKPLILAVKHWAVLRRINDPPSNTFSSYAYVMLVVAYLQRLRPPVLPCLQELCRTQPEGWDEYDIYFCRDVAAIRREMDKVSPRNTMSVGALLLGFFHAYSKQFDPSTHIACPRLGGWITRDVRGWEVSSDAKGDRHLLCVEDPFNLSHDLGRVLTAQSLPTVLAEFERAHEICADPTGTFDELCEARLATAKPARARPRRKPPVAAQ